MWHTSGETNGMSATSATVLIIEDDADTRDAIAMHLSYEGYSVKLAPYQDCALTMPTRH